MLIPRDNEKIAVGLGSIGRITSKLRIKVENLIYSTSLARVNSSDYHIFSGVYWSNNEVFNADRGWNVLFYIYIYVTPERFPERRRSGVHRSDVRILVESTLQRSRSDGHWERRILSDTVRRRKKRRRDFANVRRMVRTRKCYSEKGGNERVADRGRTFFLFLSGFVAETIGRIGRRHNLKFTSARVALMRGNRTRVRFQKTYVRAIILLATAQ